MCADRNCIYFWLPIYTFYFILQTMTHVQVLHACTVGYVPAKETLTHVHVRHHTLETIVKYVSLLKSKQFNPMLFG